MKMSSQMTHNRAKNISQKSLTVSTTKPQFKPKYIDKRKNQCSIPLSIVEDNSKNVFFTESIQVMPESRQLTSRSDIKQVLQINLKYQQTLAENKNIQKELDKIRKQRQVLRFNKAEASNKFSGSLQCIGSILASIIYHQQDLHEEEELYRAYEKIGHLIETLNDYNN